jgi:hypothetical protein
VCVREVVGASGLIFLYQVVKLIFKTAGRGTRSEDARSGHVEKITRCPMFQQRREVRRTDAPPHTYTSHRTAHGPAGTDGSIDGTTRTVQYIDIFR